MTSSSLHFPSLRPAGHSASKASVCKPLVSRPSLLGNPVNRKTRSGAIFEVRAKKNDNFNKIADAAVDIVPRPSFIPRPVARGLIGLLGAGFVWSLVQKLFTTAIFFGSIFAGLSFWFKRTWGATSK